MKKLILSCLFLIFLLPLNADAAQCNCRNTAGEYLNNPITCSGCDSNPCPIDYPDCDPVPTGNNSSSGGSVSLPNPLTGSENDKPDFNVIIGKMVNGVLGIVGSIALVMFIFGGFTWMLAAGNQQRVTKGKDILVWATVGLIVIFSAYAMVNFIFTNILKPMGTP